jgi:hypothetical protein
VEAVNGTSDDTSMRIASWGLEEVNVWTESPGIIPKPSRYGLKLIIIKLDTHLQKLPSFSPNILIDLEEHFVVSKEPLPRGGGVEVEWMGTFTGCYDWWEELI